MADVASLAKQVAALRSKMANQTLFNTPGASDVNVGKSPPRATMMHHNAAAARRRSRRCHLPACPHRL